MIEFHKWGKKMDSRLRGNDGSSSFVIPGKAVGRDLESRS